MATQARAQIALGQDGQSFLSLVSANARSLIVYPGIEAQDAEYYSRQFGDIEKVEEKEIRTTKPFDPFKGSLKFDRDVVRRAEKVTKTRFSASDIRFRPFKEITYCIVKNSTVQAPGIGKIEFIPKDVNDHLDEIIEDFRNEMNDLKEKMENKSNSKNIENKRKTLYDNTERNLSNDDETFSKEKGLDYLNSIFEGEGQPAEPDIGIDNIDEVELMDELSNDMMSIEDKVISGNGNIDIVDDESEDDLF